ncbi:MAG: hypothetical protein OXN89_00020 [Bryobacterales bacterium]|nr:hypothetical protein [Bryobacterales bacterium]
MDVGHWLLEQSTSKQLSFFLLNRLASAITVKMDFDLAMTICPQKSLQVTQVERSSLFLSCPFKSDAEEVNRELGWSVEKRSQPPES